MMDAKQFGRKCRFLYPPRKVPCNNCYQGAGGLSTGVYKPGGDVFFENTSCPVCLGKGTFEEAKVEEDVLIVLFDHNLWFQPSQVSKLPDNSVMVVGDRTKTWSKVNQCSRIVLNTDVYSDNTRWKLSGATYPVGLFNGDGKSGSRWFYAFLIQETG